MLRGGGGISSAGRCEKGGGCRLTAGTGKKAGGQCDTAGWGCWSAAACGRERAADLLQQCQGGGGCARAGAKGERFLDFASLYLFGLSCACLLLFIFFASPLCLLLKFRCSASLYNFYKLPQFQKMSTFTHSPFPPAQAQDSRSLPLSLP